MPGDETVELLEPTPDRQRRMFPSENILRLRTGSRLKCCGSVAFLFMLACICASSVVFEDLLLNRFTTSFHKMQGIFKDFYRLENEVEQKLKHSHSIERQLRFKMHPKMQNSAGKVMPFNKFFDRLIKPVMKDKFSPPKTIRKQKDTKRNRSSEALEEILGCEVPKLDPFNPALKDLTEQELMAEKCGKNRYKLVFEAYRNSTVVRLQDPAEFGLTDCCYRQITRTPYRSRKLKHPDDSQTIATACYPLNNNVTTIPDTVEFVVVSCNNEISSTMSKRKVIDVFAFTPLKPEVEKRVFDFETKNPTLRPEDRVSVIMLGLDSMSHMNLMRTMPQVYHYLVHNLSAIGMNGYTKVGENTLPNVGALLTSLNNDEISKRYQKDKCFDDFPFLWTDFAQQGYRTSYGEDSPWMSAFNYYRTGFRKPPVDYYLRPVANVAENNVANNRQGNSFICYGPRLTLQFLLRYLETFAAQMGSQKRYFQFLFSTALTHDYLNEPKLGEDSVLKTLQWLNDTGYLNNTILVFFSDHGMRFGSIREKRQGKLEDKMPFIYFTFPPWFRKQYPTAISNMISNKNLLTSPFDVHQTLKDLILLYNISETRLKSRVLSLTKLKTNLPRGLSLFLPIPKSRNCRMAGVPEKYCVCHKTTNVSTTDPFVTQGANFAVYTLNSYVANYSKCAYLALSRVQRGDAIEAQWRSKNGRMDKVFDVAFETSPGGGLFEATVSQNVTGVWSISGPIERINMYGNQSHCVNNKEIKKFCYCL